MRPKYLIFLLVLFGILNTSGFASAVDSGIDLRNGVSYTHDVEDFTLHTEYKLSADFQNWKVTGNKAIDIKVQCNSNPSNLTILIEHLHADIIIESTFSGYDELTQDSMDDSFHGIQGGFLISPTYAYYETFSIEGSSPEIQESFGYAYGNYHDNEMKNYRFSEKELTDEYGVYGTTLYVVYDIVVKNSTEQYFHKYIVTDNVFISKEGYVLENTGNAADVMSVSDIGGIDWMLLVIINTIIIGGIAIFYHLDRQKRGLSRY